MFAVWLTGLPASGKSTLAAALRDELAARGVRVVVLESDALRAILTPRPTYSEDERDAFYGALVALGRLLVEQGFPVVFDATANRRRWRERARAGIERFLEVHVECPVEVCAARDPKGIYRAARDGRAATVPGVQADYEAPEHADLTLRSDGGDPRSGARRLASLLEERRFLP